MRHLTLAAALVVALAVAGCGADDKKATPTVTETPTSSPSETAPPELGLDTTEHPAGTPLWGFTPPQGWDTTMVDQDGYNQAKGGNDCQLTTYQAKIEDGVPTVRKASESITRNYVQGVLDRASEAKKAGDGTVVLPGGLTRAGPAVEFIWARVDYRHKDGRLFSSIVASRAFVSPRAALQIAYACPTADLGSTAEALKVMQEAGSVLFD